MIDIQNFAMASFVIIGFINGVQFALDGNWSSFIKFLTALLLGAILGFYKSFGLPGIEMGIYMGIASSGVYKVVQKLGEYK